MDEDVFNGIGVPIDLENPDNFLKVKETLTRIGVASHSKKTLYQSCHILHKRGQYAIVHFKELFKLDGKSSVISESDLARRNTIAILLEEWNLIKIKKDMTGEVVTPVNQLKILPYHEKGEWILEAKYTIGNKR